MKYCVLYIVLVLILSLVSISHSYAFQQHSLSIPSKNELLKPDSLAFVQELKPLLEWKRQSPNTYDVHIYSNSLLTDTVEVVSVVDTVYRLQNHLDFNKVYYWYVVGTGGSTSPSNVWSFTTFNPKVTLVSPQDRLVSFEKPPFLHWNKTEGITNYNIQVSTDSMFSRDFAIFAVSHGDTSYPTNQLLKNKEYFWRVQAVIGQKNGAWSNFRRFIIPDNNLVKVYPDSGLVLSTNLLALRWKGLEGTKKYSVILADNAQLRAPFVIKPNVVDSFLVVQGLQTNTQYFWTVTAETDIATIPSTNWHFTILSKSELFEPKNGTVNSSKYVTFKWRRRGGKNSQSFFQLSDTVNFSRIIQDIPGTTDTVYHYDGTYILQHGKTYYWRVRQLIGDDTTYWSNTFNFKTKQIETTTHISPGNNAVGVSIDTALQWDLKDDIDSYVVRISTSPNYNPLFFEKSFNANIVTTPINNLDHNRRYYWQIRTRKEGEFSNWSPSWSFLTLMGKPVLLSPNNIAEIVPFFTTLTWQSVAGSVRYHIQIAKDSLFEEMVIDDPTLQQRQYQFTSVEPNTRYFWRVKSSSSQNIGQWSEVRSFTTKLVTSTAFDEPNKVRISPNPVVSSSQIHVSLPQNEQLHQITLSTITGVVLASFTSNNIDITFLPSGMYLVSIQTNQQKHLQTLHIIK